MAPQECGFAYRTSVFKHNDRWLVLVGRLPAARVAAVGPGPLRRTGPARSASRSATGCRWRDARRRCCELRAGKGMVLDAADPDTWSVGSFFTNPVLDPAAYDALRARAADLVSRRPGRAPTGMVKVSAAWLIEQAGFAKGYARARRRRDLRQAHAGADQPRRRHDGGAAGPGPGDPRRRARPVRRRRCTPSRSWSTARSDGLRGAEQLCTPQGDGYPPGPGQAWKRLRRTNIVGPEREDRTHRHEPTADESGRAGVRTGHAAAAASWSAARWSAASWWAAAGRRLRGGRRRRGRFVIGGVLGGGVDGDGEGVQPYPYPVGIQPCGHGFAAASATPPVSRSVGTSMARAARPCISRLRTACPPVVVDRCAPLLNEQFGL